MQHVWVWTPQVIVQTIMMGLGLLFVLFYLGWATVDAVKKEWNREED